MRRALRRWQNEPGPTPAYHWGKAGSCVVSVLEVNAPYAGSELPLLYRPLLLVCKWRLATDLFSNLSITKYLQYHEHKMYMMYHAAMTSNFTPQNQKNSEAYLIFSAKT